MRKKLCLGLALMFILFAAGAMAVFAGGTKESGTKAAPAKAAQEKIVLEFWSWNNEGSYPVVHEDAEKRFEADHPNVDVKREYISYTEYLVKLKAVLSGEEAPDVFQIPWAGEYTELARSGKLLPLTAPLKTGFPMFFDNVMKAIAVDGDAWAVPLDLNTLQIAYNKTMFDKMGLKVPTTKDEFIALAAKLKEQGKFGVAIGTKDLWAGADVFFAQVSYSDPTHTKMAMADAKKIPWTSPEFVKAIEVADELVKKGVFAPGANSMDAFVGAKNLFPFPPHAAGSEPLPTGGVAEMFVVSKGSKNTETALDFLRYMTDDKGKEILVKNDFIPSSSYKGSAAISALYKNMLDAQSKAQSRVVYNTEVYSAVMNGMQGIFGQTLTPKAFIDSLVSVSK